MNENILLMNFIPYFFHLVPCFGEFYVSFKSGQYFCTLDFFIFNLRRPPPFVWLVYSLRSNILLESLSATTELPRKELIKNVNPKISRIGRQKRKNNFFLFSPKEPIWLSISGNDIKRFDFLFLFFKIYETWKFGHRAFSGGHEAWNLVHVQHACMDAPNVVLTCPSHSLWGIS